MPVWLKEFVGDRIQINSLLIVLCFASVLVLDSQSAASYPTYFLALSMLFSVRQWNDVLSVPFFWMIAATLTYLLCSALWSDPLSLRDAFGMLGRGVLVFCFVVALGECQLRGNVQRWLGRALAVVGAVAATAAIFVFILDPPTLGRLSGLGQLDNPVVVGLVFGAVFILLLELLVADSSSGWRWMSLFGGVVVLVAIYLSGARNAWFSTAFGSLVFLFTYFVQDWRRCATALIALGIILGTILLTLALSDWGAAMLFPRGSSFRLEIWSAVLSNLSDAALVFGNGILTPDQVAIEGKIFGHPHSMYFAVLFQGGLIALGLFLALICWSVWGLFMSYQERSAKVALGLLAMALSSYLLDGHELIDKVGETWFLFWLPVGVSLGFAWSRNLREVEITA